MTTKKSMRDLPDTAFDNARVLIRVDWNVPLTPEGTVSSEQRILKTLPTLNYLLERNAKIIVMSHLGRPKGTADPAFSLAPAVANLKTHLPNTAIHLAKACQGESVQQQVNQLQPKEILVLENIRFEPGETKNDTALAQTLASYGDIYVNDAFGTAHRAHASTEGVTHHMDTCVAGLLMDTELKTLTQLFDSPKRPFTAILGGSKVSTKIGVLSRLSQVADNLIIGGGMVFTLLKAQGLDVGKSLVEDEMLPIATDFLAQAKAQSTTVLLPTDVVVADQFSADAKHQTVPVDSIPADWMGLDLGPETTQTIQVMLGSSQTVLWNGPLGVFEFPAFADCTQATATTLAELTKSKAVTSVLGGGDTLAAIDAFDIAASRYTHVSTGGGASLEFIEGKDLPGVEALDTLEAYSTYR